MIQKGYAMGHFETCNTAQDIALIKTGFDHVRLSVNPQPMFRARQADNIPVEYLRELDDCSDSGTGKTPCDGAIWHGPVEYGPPR